MNSKPTPNDGKPLELPQYMTALKRADEVRLGRARVKQAIASGKTTVAEALAVECCQSAKVFDLLRAQCRWGNVRAAAFLLTIPLSEAKTVGSLTDRQRRVLLDALARRGR